MLIATLWTLAAMAVLAALDGCPCGALIATLWTLAAMAVLAASRGHHGRVAREVELGLTAAVLGDTDLFWDSHVVKDSHPRRDTRG